MRVLVLNPGSSTLKAAVLEPPAVAPLASAEVERGSDASRQEDASDAVRRALDAVGLDRGQAPTITAVGYRVAHGGTRLTAPLVVDDGVLAEIESLSPLAPLHNPVAAATIRAGRTLLPAATHVAAFDTAFHATLPDDAIRYAVPARWAAEWGVRRFGFHGLSVQWATRRTAEILGRAAGDLGILVAHLGSGCSVTAVEGGRSVDTSMGMTPLEGLVMGTRAGSIDPGILLGLLRDEHLGLDELAEDLDHAAGLLGLSGRSADVRELLAAEAAGDEAARLALAVFVRRAAAGIAAAATALRRVDAIVFTGGIGQHSGPLRRRILGRLGALGVDSAFAADADRPSDLGDWSLAARTGPSVVIVAAREDVVIAEAAAELAGSG
ncbi:MAG TPA: acetate/propionate family kinase [Candidatus Limnocylindrales bacterium]|nr:acetate/propionate family kinase [Candidatus Limnocylindrales bacterium]